MGAGVVTAEHVSEDHHARWQGHHFFVDGALTVAAVGTEYSQSCALWIQEGRRARSQRDLGYDTRVLERHSEKGQA